MCDVIGGAATAADPRNPGFLGSAAVAATAADPRNPGLPGHPGAPKINEKTFKFSLEILQHFGLILGPFWHYFWTFLVMNFVSFFDVRF